MSHTVVTDFDYYNERLTASEQKDRWDLAAFYCKRTWLLILLILV
jgi:hypothetical protein